MSSALSPQILQAAFTAKYKLEATLFFFCGSAVRRNY
jgi:hypothetical protein